MKEYGLSYNIRKGSDIKRFHIGGLKSEGAAKALLKEKRASEKGYIGSVIIETDHDKKTVTVIFNDKVK